MPTFEKAKELLDKGIIGKAFDYILRLKK